MALNEAYGQTDVMHDLNYIRSLLGNPNPRLRAQGEAALRDLQARENQHEQLMQFQQREADRQAAHEGNLGVREAGVENQRLAKEELNQRGQAAEGDRKTALMAHLLANPMALQNLQGNTPDAAINKAIVNKMLSDAGVSVTMPTDPKLAAAAKLAGKPAPVGEVLGGGGQQPATQSTSLPAGFAPGNPGSPTVGPLPNIQRNVDAGHVVGPMAAQIPAGNDFNFNTGELVAKNKEGTINGMPAGRAIAEGAMRTGIMPESDTGTRALKAMNTKPQFSANQSPEPAFRGHGAGSSWGPSELAATPPAPQQSKLVGAGELASPPLTLGEGVQAPKVAGLPNPNPNPTPAPGSQQPGAIASTVSDVAKNPFTLPNAPVPNLALTPPALPPSKKLTPEEQQMVFNQ